MIPILQHLTPLGSRSLTTNWMQPDGKYSISAPSMKHTSPTSIYKPHPSLCRSQVQFLSSGLEMNSTYPVGTDRT
jgi:hypothetical protein